MTTTTHDLASVLRTKIERAIANHPRSLQDALGPSQLGTACDRCLVNLLAGHKPLEGHAPWLPTIGTAVHTWLEDAMRLAAWMDDDGDRWHIEERVVVGDLGGVPVTGSTDLFDAATGTVVDYKCVGTTTLRKVRSSGPSLTYQRQAHLYGKGWQDAGHDVSTVLIYFLPRNAVTLDAAHVWSAPYDRAVAETTLTRANALAAGIAALGADTVLGSTPPHTGEEFACGKFPTDPPADVAGVSADAYLGLG